MHVVLSGSWELHLPHLSKVVIEPGHGGQRGRSQPIQVPLSLFNLEQDIGETTNVVGQRPEVMRRLMTFIERARRPRRFADQTRRKNARPAVH